MRIITQWLLVCSVLMGGVYLFPSSVQIEPLYMVLVLGAVIRVLNATLRPFLLLFTLPFTLFTLGFFILVVNGFVFHLAARWVDGVSYSFTAAFLLALVTAALDSMTQDKRGRHPMLSFIDLVASQLKRKKMRLKMCHLLK